MTTYSTGGDVARFRIVTVSVTGGLFERQYRMDTTGAVFQRDYRPGYAGKAWTDWQAVGHDGAALATAAAVALLMADVAA